MDGGRDAIFGGNCTPFTLEIAFRLKNSPLREMLITSLREAEEMHAFAPEINRLERGGSGIGLANI